MNNKLTAAYSELTRVLPWSLRALGYAFGVADRASHIVTTAAVFTPCVLDQMALGRERVNTCARFDWLNEQTLSITAQGLSLLELGPITMDLVAGCAAPDSITRVLCDSVADLDLLPAVLLVGADYGLCSVALTAQGWTLLGRQKGAQLIARGKHLNDLEGLLGASPKGLIEGLRQAQCVVEGGLVMFVTHEQLEVGHQSGAFTIDDTQACVERAHREGLPIAADTLVAIYALEKRTWAPSSERSRAQAGFGPIPQGASK